jgi:hypothetical protein
MANDRYRYDRDRFRERDDERGRDWGEPRRREDDGYVARRGFGNESAGYDRSRSDEGGRSGYERSGYGRGADERYGSGRERDFGDSAGYGTGGSTRDWHDVMGEDRDRAGGSYGSGRSRERGYGSGFFGRDEDSRYGASDFGRGSRGDDDERGFLERAGDEVRSWFGDEDAERRRMRDSRDQGYHRGRGPKNYQRSDDRIRDDVNDRLTDDPHIDASEIEVSVQTREVTLSGTVNSRFEKRHAEDLAESVSGVAHVQNNLRVQQPAGMSGSSMSGASAGMGASSGSASGSDLNVGAGGSGTATQSPGGETGGASGTRRRASSTSGT